ncbi:MAG: zf-HC2 domain-containing protein [Planctomycetales bacterium]|nr:zf-HC2 domain-containing protein [Planctomycetales bacterium]
MTGPLPCSRARAVLSPWLDGRLPAPEVAAVEAHLASCPACAREAREMRAGDAAARAASPDAPPSPDFLPGLDRKIARGVAPAPSARFVSLARAALPIAAGLALGAGGTFLAARALRSWPGLPVASADDALGRFAAASEAFLTDAVHHCGEDPARDVELLRRETEALRLPEAIAGARAAIPAIRTANPALARKVEVAAEGTDGLVRRLSTAGRPERALFAIWDDEERLHLRALVRELCPGGLPDPRAATRRSPVAAGSDALSAYLAGLGNYAGGRLEPARECWERIVARPPDRRWASRAAYWASRAYVLEGRVQDAVKLLEPVAGWCPDAVRDTALGSAIWFELADFGKGPRIQVFALGDLGRELGEPLAALLGPAPPPSPPAASVRLEELASVRVDDCDVPLVEAEVRDELRDLCGMVARRLHGQARCEVRSDGPGLRTLAFDLAPRGDERCRFRTPPGRRLAEVLSRALGRPLHDADGYSLVSRIEVSGRAAPVEEGAGRR